MNFRKIILLIPLLSLSSCSFSSEKPINNKEKETHINEDDEEQKHEDNPNPGNVSKWPSDKQKYITTFLNGKLPYYSKFTGFKTGTIDQSQKPYFNPYVENCNNTVNYVNDYKTLLHDAGFSDDGSDVDEDGDTVYYYHLGEIYVQFSKYKADIKYWFDVYAYNDHEVTEKLDGYYYLTAETMGLPKKYGNYSTTISKWNFTTTSVMKNNSQIQLAKDDGIIKIDGSITNLFVELTKGADACFVKDKSGNHYFNNGGLFTFPNGTNHVEIYSFSRVVTFEAIYLK